MRATFTIIFLGLTVAIHSARADTLSVIVPMEFAETKTPTTGHGAHLYHLFDLHGSYLGASGQYNGSAIVSELEAGDGFCSIGLIYQGKAVEMLGEGNDYSYRYSAAELPLQSGVPISITSSGGGTNNLKGTLFTIVHVGINSNCSEGACSASGIPAKPTIGMGQIKVASIHCATAVKRDSGNSRPTLKQLLELALGNHLVLQ